MLLDGKKVVLPVQCYGKRTLQTVLKSWPGTVVHENSFAGLSVEDPVVDLTHVGDEHVVESVPVATQSVEKVAA